MLTTVYTPPSPDGLAHMTTRVSSGLNAAEVTLRIADPHEAVRLLEAALDEVRARIWEDPRA